MSDLTQLNEEQKKAVNHGEGPLLIIAGAGTGKTTVVTKRVEYLILEKKIDPSNILALTFTEKAALEMEKRIDIILPYGYTSLWISTFHSFCDRILRDEAIHIGLNPGYKLSTEAEIMLFLKKNLFKLQLDYFRPLGNPYKFLQGLVQHFNRLKDDDITPDDYLKFANDIDNNSDKEEYTKTMELANAYKIYEDIKSKEGIMDFSDLNSNVLKLFRKRMNVLRTYQEKFKYILVDEFQDTNYAQNTLAMMIAGEKRNINVVGDDDQCLPGETLISTVQGKKQIKFIKEGDRVLTGVGKGSVGISTVAKVFKNKKTKEFITLTTKSGQTVTTTSNHKMFCYVPKTVLNKKFHYVYLMHRKNLGWRLGTTMDLAVRLKLERSSDAIIGLRAFPSEQQARYHELLWSLQYQLPTCIFKEREGVILQGEYVDRLYKEFDTEANARKLAKHLGINLDNYHYVLDAVTRGQSKRVKINLYQCNRSYVTKSIRKNMILKNPTVLHTVHLETSNTEIIKKLEENEINLQLAKKGKRVRMSFAELSEAYQFAEKLANITEGFIEIKSTIATLIQVNIPALIMPAGNILEGLYVPVIRDNRIYYEEVTSVSRTKQTLVVYDLEIAKTHNFIANDIIVHNSIYRWRGAAIANIIQFRKNYPDAKIVTLTKNYRSNQEVLDAAYKLIQHNNPDRLEVKEKIDKQLTAMKNFVSSNDKQVQFLYSNRVENEAENVKNTIKKLIAEKNLQYKDIAILVRANDHSQPFVRSLERARIPYQFLGPGHLFHQEEIKDFISYLRVLANFEDNAAMYRTLTIPVFDFDARDLAALLNYAKKQNLSLFEACEQVDQIFVKDQTKETTKRIIEMIKKHLEKVPRETAGQILYYFLDDSGLLRQYLDASLPHEERLAQNIAKFFEKLKEFESSHTDSSVFAVTEWIELAMQLGESPKASDMDWSDTNAVNILTIHSSKGLEFPAVFLVNLVSQRFPTRNRKEQIPIHNDLIKETLPEGDYHTQEERRLFYVGMTRARDYLYLCASASYNEGKSIRKVSPFVYEALGEDAVNKLIQKETEIRSVQQLSLLDLANDQAQQTTLSDERLINQASSGSTLRSMPYAISYISYSQIQSFDICPLHYKLKNILKIPTPPSSAQNIGISIHNALKDYFGRKIQGEDVEKLSIESLLKQNWLNTGFESKEHMSQAFSQASSSLTRFLNTPENINAIPLALETPFGFFLKNTTGVSLKVGGRIDRIDSLSDNKIEIIDYKTGSKIPDQKKLDEDLQLSIYALAASEVHNKIFNRKPENVVLSLWFVDQDLKVSTTRTAEQLVLIKQQILDKITEISTSNFTCRGSIICQNCEYKMLCNSYSN